MKRLLPVFPLAVVLLAASTGAATAGDDDYVLVEIKGTFNMAKPGGPPRPGIGPVSVRAGGQDFVLELKSMPGGPPTEKQLKEFVDKKVVVSGKLELPLEGAPRIHVTRITLYKEPVPIMN